MVLATHDLWRHVAGCTRGVRTVLGAEDLGDAHVSDAHVAVFFHHDVLRLDVSVDHALVVHVLKPKHHASDHEFGLFLIKSSSLADMESQITAR